jgi:hypothetical protein
LQGQRQRADARDWGRDFVKIYRVGIAAILEIEAVNETAVSNVLSSLYSDGGLTRHGGPWPGVDSVAFFMCDQDGTIEELPEDEDEEPSS